MTKFTITSLPLHGLLEDMDGNYIDENELPHDLPTNSTPVVIYRVIKDYYGLDEPVTGFLVSFPKSETAKTIEYMVNPIYFSDEER